MSITVAVANLILELKKESTVESPLKALVLTKEARTAILRNIRMEEESRLPQSPELGNNPKSGEITAIEVLGIPVLDEGHLDVK